jgi:hypothetical protein
MQSAVLTARAGGGATNSMKQTAWFEASHIARHFVVAAGYALAHFTICGLCMKQSYILLEIASRQKTHDFYNNGKNARS